MASPQELTDFFHELGSRLRNARINRHETQADLGVRSGISRQSIIKMEHGDPAVSLEKWGKVSAALGLLPTWSGVLKLPADPFAEYDTRQEHEKQLRMTRVRKK